MPIQPNYPGVYIQEISSGVKTITGVSTSIAAFIGRTADGPIDKAVRCTSFSDFLRNFGDGHPRSDLNNSVKQFFDNGGSDCYIVRISNGETTADITLTSDATGNPGVLLVKAKSPGAWGNNIKLNITLNPHVNGVDDTFNLTVYEQIDGTIAASESYTDLSMNPVAARYVVSFVTQSSNLIDVELAPAASPQLPPIKFKNGPQPKKVSTPDPTPTDPSDDPDPDYVLGDTLTSDFQGATTLGLDESAATALASIDYTGNPLFRTGIYALDRVDLFNLMILPGDQDVSEAMFALMIGEVSTYCENNRAFLLIDAPATWTLGEQVKADKTKIDAFRTLVATSSKYSAIFYPRVKVNNAGVIKTMGASGIIAGLMARTDSQRGVWKAPAGTEASLRGALDVEINLTDNENGDLNKLGVNCIRKFPTGIVNWGARTLDGSDEIGSEWKYIPIRRLALFLEESLFRGTKWVVFEPNDEPLWAQIRMNITAFMMNLFRQGAFQGTTPDKAFFVKCDSETTTQNDRNLGIVNIQIGFAPLKPAEFVIITIQQMAGDLV